MPLEKGKIDVYFRSGMAGDTDPRVVPVGAFLDIKNAYVDKKGALAKRNGFQKLSTDLFDGSTIPSARGLFSSGDELCIPGARRLYARDDTSGKWNDRGSLSPVTGETRRFFSEPAVVYPTQTDVSTNDGYTLYLTSYATYSSGRDSPEFRTDARIDSDDNNVVVERHPIDFGTTGTTVKAAFCSGGLLACFYKLGVGYVVGKYDTASLSTPISAFTAVADANIGDINTHPQRADVCGHSGATATGEWSIRYVRSATYDFVVERYDAAFPAPVNTSTVVFAGASNARVYLDGSISDDPINNRTLAILVYQDGEEPEIGGAVKIDLASIDHATGAVLWQTHVDTLDPATEVVWSMAGPKRLVTPDTFGVSRGAHADGQEVVAGVYSICKNATHSAFTNGMGSYNAWSSTQILYDGADPESPAALNSPSEFGHPNYASIAVGSASGYSALGLSTNSQRTSKKWMSIRYAATDAATGVIVNDKAYREVKNAQLVSKPFYNGRHIYAWCKTNLNIGSGYETSFCLDLRIDLDDPPAGGSRYQPPYVVAVKDVGTAVTPAHGQTQNDQLRRGPGQAADRDSLGRVVSSNRVVTDALVYRHGEVVTRLAALAFFPMGNMSTACEATLLTFSSPVSVASLSDGATVLSGGNISWYDSQKCMELSYVAPPVFDHFWSNIASSEDGWLGSEPITGWPRPTSRLPIDTVTPSDTPALTFVYQTMWKSYDAKGYLHRSILSPPYEAPTLNPAWSVEWPPVSISASPYINSFKYFDNLIYAAGSRLDVNVMFLKTSPATNRFMDSGNTADHAGSCRIFRDFTNSGLFQEVNANDENVYNSNSRWYNLFVDYGQDLTQPYETAVSGLEKLTSPGGEVLYTVSGEIEGVIPSGSKLVTYANDRVWLGGFYRADRLAYSKKITPEGASLQKIAPEFNEAFVLTTPANAPITGLSSLDDKIVAFTKDHVYVVAGDGPDRTGANNTFSALSLVSSDSGCIDSRSTVEFPGGVMFQSKSGIHLLGRNLAVQFIGEPIRDITNIYPVITSAVAVPDKTQVRFTAVTSEDIGATGVIVVYDYRVNQWMYWSIAGAAGANIAFAGATMHKDSYYAVEPDGTLWKEDALKWKDEADNIYYQMSIKTAWLQAAQQSGWQRVYRATALCEQKGVMSMRMSVANDFNSTTSQVASWDDTEIATFPEPPRVQPMIHVKRQQCQAIQLYINDEVPTGGVGATTGEGFTIAGFSLEVGLKSGMVKVSKQQRS